MPVVIRPATSSLDRDAIYRLRAASGRCVSMAPPPPWVPVPREMSVEDAWPETRLLLAESEGRCLGAARVDGERVSVTLCLEAAFIEDALRRSVQALSAPAVLPMHRRLLLAPGEVIFRAMDDADTLMEVVGGTVCAAGQQLGAGERLGVSAVIPGGRRLADAVAGVGGAEVRAIAAGTLHAMMAEEPMLRIQLGHALSERLVRAISARGQAKISA